MLIQGIMGLFCVMEKDMSRTRLLHDSLSFVSHGSANDTPRNILNSTDIKIYCNMICVLVTATSYCNLLDFWTCFTRFNKLHCLAHIFFLNKSMPSCISGRQRLTNVATANLGYGTC